MLRQRKAAKDEATKATDSKNNRVNQTRAYEKRTERNMQMKTERNTRMRTKTTRSPMGTRIERIHHMNEA
jgi:hypothetical protein